jgi:predicted RNA-binding Zn-ribbon protein involved in translation (DUF1610 family)
MGLLDRLFGKKADSPKPGSREAREQADQALDGLIGISGRAKLSASGHPLCPRCGKEFPVSAQQMREQSSGIMLSFICPGCKAMIRL